MEFILVYITAPTIDSAKFIAKSLLEIKLIACANITSNVQSLYFWEGSLEESSEAVIICKTKAKNFQKIVDKVKEIHEYNAPCIIAYPIISGDQSFLAWIAENTE